MLHIIHPHLPLNGWVFSHTQMSHNPHTHTYTHTHTHTHTYTEISVSNWRGAVGRGEGFFSFSPPASWCIFSPTFFPFFLLLYFPSFYAFLLEMEGFFSFSLPASWCMFFPAYFFGPPLLFYPFLRIPPRNGRLLLVASPGHWNDVFLIQCFLLFFTPWKRRRYLLAFFWLSFGFLLAFFWLPFCFFLAFSLLFLCSLFAFFSLSTCFLFAFYCFHFAFCSFLRSSCFLLQTL